MDLFSVAERLATTDHSTVAYQSERCLHAFDKYSTCERCMATCPVQAITPGSPPEFESKLCLDCLACLPACPSGAFCAKDDLANILTCMARINHRQVEILCARNPHSEIGVSPEATAICIDSCLAGIGTGGFLAIAGIGIGAILIRTEACQVCPLNQLATTIERQISQANQILEVLNHTLRLQTSAPGDINSYSCRPIWDARNPPLTRRDLFRMISASGKVTLARSLALDNLSGVSQPALDQRRIVMSIQHLGGESSSPTSFLPDLLFAKIQANSACTACGVCARTCPNGALTMIHDEDRLLYQLRIRPAACNGCEVCLHLCASQALEIDHSPRFKEIFNPHETIILHQGVLKRCQRCSQLIAATISNPLCPPCEFRRNNPFGTRLPSPSFPSVQHSKSEN